MPECQACLLAEKQMRDPREFPHHTPTTPAPSMEQLHNWAFDFEDPEATDGCPTEPDGHCRHGHPSWLLAMGLI